MAEKEQLRRGINRPVDANIGTESGLDDSDVEHDDDCRGDPSSDADTSEDVARDGEDQFESSDEFINDDPESDGGSSEIGDDESAADSYPGTENNAMGRYTLVYRQGQCYVIHNLLGNFLAEPPAVRPVLRDLILRIRTVWNDHINFA